ncbi:bifunctional diguanylate cyclase/phosphodiesterase [Hahella sp. HN01]|uniref:putative bifunctional diguanylate cyclase/phosphodiesterase n=1 Tax=Hahella sp. HN01 TaxID=2847262 RepID=UPI001C1ECE63|nr:EAL domain-containing protein [Hahella sp. HN01]MBU6954020.1 EAL domain-containing protein [Hahella sp. HN01]
MDAQALQIDPRLRSHLLLATLSLAIFVSTVFVVVAYRIASDLGVNSELKAAEINVALLSAQTDLANSESELESLLAPSGHYIEELQVKENIGVLVRNDTDFVVFSSGVSQSTIEAVTALLDEETTGSGLIELEGETYLWAAIKSHHNKQNYSLWVQETSSLDTLLHYIATRLTVTSFLTFWVAVWGALILSGIITKRIEKHNEALAYMASHDYLTDLPSRRYVFEQMSAHIEKARGADDCSHCGALLLLDLDQFKEINDTLGHSYGDEILKKISRRWRDALPSSHILARTGGDEFVVWTANLKTDNAAKIAAPLIEACERPFEVSGMLLNVDVSIGAAYFPKDGDTIEELMKNADIAMYHAKRKRSRLEMYAAADNPYTEIRVRLAGEVTQALSEEQFVLHYQPKVHLQTCQVTGAEALVRWNHPREGLIYPGAFIELIEHSDYIHAFSRYVLSHAIQQIQKWRDQGLEVSVAVNLSPYNLLDRSMTAFIREQLDHYGVTPEMLEIELTETATMIDIQTTQAVFKSFRELGVKLSLDDFGVGMSSLSYIKNLELDCIKLDRSFVLNMLSDPCDKAIVQTMLDLCANLGYQAVAEGVETQELADLLTNLGCAYGQGYFFAKPMPADQFVRFMQDTPKRRSA